MLIGTLVCDGTLPILLILILQKHFSAIRLPLPSPPPTSQQEAPTATDQLREKRDPPSPSYEKRALYVQRGKGRGGRNVADFFTGN